MKNKVKELRDSIFSLNTRKFGTVNEMLVERIVEEFGLIVEEPKDTSYDRKIDNSKDEIKGSRVLKESKLKFSKENIIDCILNHESHRMIKLEDASKNTWDSNIQQIKTDLFSTLWYSLYFEDKVVLFKIKNNLIKEDKKINYSDKQHRKNVGEGQFHVSNKNINYHLDNYLVKIITYDEVYEKLSQNTGCLEKNLIFVEQLKKTNELLTFCIL